MITNNIHNTMEKKGLSLNSLTLELEGFRTPFKANLVSKRLVELSTTKELEGLQKAQIGSN